MATNSNNNQQAQENANSGGEKSIPMLRTILDLSLYPRQIPQFRGALIAQAGWEKDHLHNHKGKAEYHYRYPLIQYRVIKGKAAIIGIGEGSETLRRALLEVRELQIGNTKVPLRINHLSEEEVTIKMLPQAREYRLMDWLPLNSENYQLWKNAKGLSQQTALLDKLLVGQLITLANGVNWQIPERMEAYLTALHKIKTVKVHGQDRVAFNVSFMANIDIPTDLAIGRSVAFGFGVTYPFKK